MYTTCGKPTRRFLIQSTSTTSSALTAAIQAGETTVVIFFNTASLHVDPIGYNPMDFVGLSTTAPTAATIATALTATTALASQTAAAAAAATIAATLPFVFDS